MGNSVLPEEIVITDSSSLMEGVALDRYGKIFLLVDENTERYCLPLLEEVLGASVAFVRIVVPVGERHKTLSACEEVWRVMMDHGADRDACLWVLGGGVVCDMGALAASLFKRGIDYFLFPTSLLAQIDASVGGKTAVNFQGYKNQIGCFSTPKGVVINPDFLQTLPQRHINAGYFEMLKHGILADKTHFEALCALPEVTSYAITPYIEPSLQVKIAFVQEDPFEQGGRKALNFGHTIGHALESFSFSLGRDGALLHGEAVALGMIAELVVAERLFAWGAAVRERLEEKVGAMLRWRFSREDFSTILHYMVHDKKNHSGHICMALPQEETIALNVKVSEALVMEALDYVRNWLNKW